MSRLKCQPISECRRSNTKYFNIDTCYQVSITQWRQEATKITASTKKKKNELISSLSWSTKVSHSKLKLLLFVELTLELPILDGYTAVRYYRNLTHLISQDFIRLNKKMLYRWRIQTKQYMDLTSQRVSCRYCLNKFGKVKLRCD